MNDAARTFALAAPLVVLIGVDKGGFAGAFGLLAVPLMALIVPPFEAAAILLPVLVAMDGYGAWAYRKTWSRALLRPLLAGALVGLAAGFVLAGRIPDETARFVIGLMALLFPVMNGLSRRARARGGAERAEAGAPWYGAICGALAGFGSFVAHAGGPPFQMFMLPLRMDRRVFVGTSVMFFALLNVVKVAAYGALGWFDPKRMGAALCLVPLGPVGVALGRVAVERLPDKPFYRIAHVVLVVVGAKLLWDGLAH